MKDSEKAELLVKAFKPLLDSVEFEFLSLLKINPNRQISFRTCYHSTGDDTSSRDMGLAVGTLTGYMTARFPYLKIEKEIDLTKVDAFPEEDWYAVLSLIDREDGKTLDLKVYRGKVIQSLFNGGLTARGN